MHGDWDISTKRVLMTGATGGIGLAAAVQFVRAKASLVLTARSPERARSALEMLKKVDPNADIEFLFGDLSLMDDVRTIGANYRERFSTLDVLVNNAGAVFKTRQETIEGFEQTWALNHLCPFLLTHELVGLLKEADQARIITTSSGAHQLGVINFNDPGAEHRYRSFRRYGETKLANILFTSELARRLIETSVQAYCFHPGLVATGFNKNNDVFGRALMKVVAPFSRTPARGAQTLVWLASDATSNKPDGGYFFNEKLRTPSMAARDGVLAARLWEQSIEQLTPWLSSSREF